MQYSSTIPVKSNVFPDVKFVLRKMTEARRAEFVLATAEMQARLRELNQANALLLDEVRASGDSIPAELEARCQASAQAITTLLSSELNPAYVRVFLKSISGLELVEDEDTDPVPLTTAEQLIQSGPPELFAEVCGAIQATIEMKESELKNFVLPSISGAPMDGSEMNTGVETASSADTSAAATAPNTSPSS